MYKSAFLDEFEKSALGPIGWLRVAFPWIRKAMAARRTAPVFGLSQKALKAGTTKTYKPMPWHGGAGVPLKQRPARILKAWTGSVLNPIYAAERNIGLAWKNPQAVSKLLGRHKASFMHKTWVPDTSKTYGPITSLLQRLQAKPKGVFIKRNPIQPGGNIHRRTIGGLVTHGAVGTGAGMGAIDFAVTPGSLGKKLKGGAKGTVAWGPLRTLTATKITGYDIPKMFLKKPPRPEVYQQPYWYKAANKT